VADIAIGIDLGTSNSCVAYAADDAIEVLPNAYGEKTTASVVAFREDGSISVGNAARAHIIHDPENTVHCAKRLIGRYFFTDEVKKARAICSYSIVEGENHTLRIQSRGEDFSLSEISAMVLRELKSIAEARLGQPVSKAVITVPAYFNDNQRKATIDAGRIAGLDVLRIINEPTAAALAYGFGKGLKQRVAIYDLGGGTFDISLLEIGDDIFEVLAVSGDTFLGGEDFDDRIIDLLADEFVTKHGINLRNDRYALEKLRAASEEAKCRLSVDEEALIRIPEVIERDGSSLSLERTLTRAELSALVSDLIQRTFKVCDEVLQEAGIVARDLDGVVVVGGPTRLPLVRDAVRSYFQQDPKTDVDPDLVVAMGAAIQASSLVSTSSDAFLLDVTPLSLRIGVAGGLAETVIERNTPVPIEQTRTFTTFKDHQESVSIRVYQGESREADEIEHLGQFEFSGFEKARRGEVEIDVTFEIDTDGIVGIRARDRRTGEEASTRITLSSGLSENEIQSIIEKNDTDRVKTEALPQSKSLPQQDEVREALSGLPLTDTSPAFASKSAPAPEASPALSALPEPHAPQPEAQPTIVAAPAPAPAHATESPRASEPAETALHSEPGDIGPYATTIPDLSEAPEFSADEEEPTAEYEIYLDLGDSDVAAASIDLDPAEEAEIDLEIDATNVHELTEDLSIGTPDTSSELTRNASPAAEEPVEGDKADLFEHSGAELTAEKDERNED